jgi:calcineurin-like phosphoesterase family protein
MILDSPAYGIYAMMQSPISHFPFDDQTWIISDTHFFHANIGRYCDRPDGWQELIIENWSRFIHPEEVVFHVGDLALGKKENLDSLAALLNSRLYLMRGNHDRRGSAFYQQLGITLVPDPYWINHPSGLRLIFSHRPIVPLELGVLNLHGHIHNNSVPEPGARHVNLCVEVRDYRPWRLDEILAHYLLPSIQHIK